MTNNTTQLGPSDGILPGLWKHHSGAFYQVLGVGYTFGGNSRVVITVDRKGIWHSVDYDYFIGTEKNDKGVEVNVFTLHSEKK